MSDGSISQSELDKLFGGGLEELPEESQHIWLIKSDNAVFGGRCYSFWQAQTSLEKVRKEYPGFKLEIKQVK